MNYDASKYKTLGIGDRVEAGHYKKGADWDSGSAPIPVGNADVGLIVGQDDAVYYFRPVEAIAKDTFTTGAARSKQEGRGRFDLVPYAPMLALAKRYEMGAIHFGDQNWRKGTPLSRILSSMRRHSSQVGYDFTEDHAAAVAWNAFAWITIIQDIRAGILPRDLDDLGVLEKEVAR